MKKIRRISFYRSFETEHLIRVMIKNGEEMTKEYKDESDIHAKSIIKDLTQRWTNNN